MQQGITLVPYPGGSGQIPTGAMQFQDDWPGLFLRGDAAISVLSAIRILQQFANHQDIAVVAAVNRLQRIADMIDRDVVQRS